MDTPSPPPVQPLDPLTQQAEQRSQNELIAGLQTQARGDMGSLMAAYGKLAMAMGTAPSVVGGSSKAVA
jgi:hypothetical protein